MRYMYSKAYVTMLLTRIGELSINNERLVDSANRHKQWLDKAKRKLKRDTRESFDDAFNDAAVSYLIVHKQNWPTAIINGTDVTIRPTMTTDLVDNSKVKYSIHNSVYVFQLDTVVKIEDIVSIKFDYDTMTNLLLFTSFSSILRKLS